MSAAVGRALRLVMLVLAGFVVVGGIGGTALAASSAPTVSRTEAITQLDVVRGSIDHTLTLIKNGQPAQALAEARTGYLDHFEFVEIPLRLADARLTSDAETKFAEIRGLISSGAPVDEIRTNIVELRGLIDQAERKLTDVGVGAPAVIAGQAFVIIFREGLEAVLLISVLLGYLERAKATQYRRPILLGMAGAGVASIITFVLLRTLLPALPVGREVLEAVTALVAVAVLFYVSFWLVARLEQKRWLEFLRARVWTAVSVGSTTALLLVGFTAVYREGFETALFYQALLSFGPGLGRYVALGLGVGVVVLAVAAWLILRLGRRLPIKAFLGTAVVLLMVTSVALLGNAIRALQEADVVSLTRWSGWPRAPIFVAQSAGYWPSRETMLAQGALSAVYLLGALYVFVIRPRRHRVSPVPAAAPAAPPAATTTDASGVAGNGTGKRVGASADADG
ncbi:MAG: high-affinity iron transporter [Mycobacteriales bacterium]|jgi:high-affinity iron transporter